MMNEAREKYEQMLTFDETRPDDAQRCQLFYVIAATDRYRAVSAKIYDFGTRALKEGWDGIFYGSDACLLQRSAHLFDRSVEDVPTRLLLESRRIRDIETAVNAQLIAAGLCDAHILLSPLGQ